eukprot:TRINITY_DN22022_c0_g1_i1.p1 TRINITY_DN22022_c0_g1~~TRINITY_DN22022_c0_g1_i1.p1  ORF type:complete len:255 (-),score=58.21 TRINITY_DN22022_c0_g1_i1:73-837(-)
MTRREMLRPATRLPLLLSLVCSLSSKRLFPCFFQSKPTQADFITSEELNQAARRLNVELRENVAGPWYQIELYSGDRQLGKTSGWAQPWGTLHLETIEVRRFTGYWVSKPVKKEESSDDPKRIEAAAAATEEAERQQYADISKVARWFGLLLSVAIGCWNRERSPFYCKEAVLLAIKDEEKQHQRLVRYYKGLGFRKVKDPDELEIQDQIIWGGEGTMMRTGADEFMAKWTPVVRQLAQPERSGGEKDLSSSEP